MAENEEEVEKDEAEDSESSAAQAKKKLIFGGGALSVVVTGVMAAMMAVPSVEKKPQMVGPFTMPLFEEQFSCNIKVQGFTRFLQMTPDINFYAYDKDYLATRTTDELYPPARYSEVFRVATSRSTDEIYGEVDQQTFMEELREALDPVLFPVHIGDTSLPWDADKTSGLRPGFSSDRDTFRGLFHDHVLHVDASNLTLKIDDGPETTFEAGDRNVKVLSVEGERVHIDTSELDPVFVGEVQIGIRGRIMRILPTGLMVQ